MPLPLQYVSAERPAFKTSLTATSPILKFMDCLCRSSMHQIMFKINARYFLIRVVKIKCQLRKPHQRSYLLCIITVTFVSQLPVSQR